MNEYPGKYHTLREHKKIHRGLTYTIKGNCAPHNNKLNSVSNIQYQHNYLSSR